jgi:pilin isopeptide linkage protein
MQRKTTPKIFLSAVLLLCLLTALCVPAYAAEETAHTAHIPVTQVFTTYADTEKPFSYKLTALENGNPLPDGAEADTYRFTLTGNTEQRLAITYVHAGLYRYRLEQVVDTQEKGYTYDGQIYTIAVQVKNTEDGGLDSEFFVYRQDDGKTEGITFANSFQVEASDASLMPDLPVKVRVEGNPKKDADFTFVLKAADPSYSLPGTGEGDERTLTITGSGEGRFGTWSYTDPGTYTYTVYQQDLGAEGYTYDKTVYTITDTVTVEGNGRLVVSRTVGDHTGKASEEYLFVNKYAQNGSGPQTGDDAKTLLWIVLAAAALSGMGTVYMVFGRRRKEEDNG